MLFNMNRRHFIVAFLLAFLAASQPAVSEVIDKVLVVIDNNFIITLSDIRKERAIQKALGGDPGNDESLIEALIERHLVEEQIVLFREVDVDEQAVNDRLRGAQAPSGVSTAELRDAVRAELRRYEFSVQRFRPFIRVSDDELRKYFEEVAVPALKKNGKPIPAVEQGMLEVRSNVIAEKMNMEVSAWLADLRRRSTIEKIVN
jgi:hypothetical protein